MDTYMLIQWKDVNDKILNDPSKYIVLKEYETNPSLIGLSPDLEYFKEVIPYEQPVVDYRLTSLAVTLTMTEDTTEVEGVTLRCYNRLYEVVDRSVEDKKISVDEIKELANLSVFPSTKHLEYLTMYAVIVRRELLGLNISTKQQAILNKVDAKALKIWTNHIAASSKKEAIDNNEPIDLDQDWETIDPENE